MKLEEEKEDYIVTMAYEINMMRVATILIMILHYYHAYYYIITIIIETHLLQLFLRIINAVFKNKKNMRH